ncbi:MAG: tRNA pseudouridine38-40 synthase [Alphaproteobacteria bacterium]
MSLRRIKLTVEYDGSNFHGWQRQPDRVTVQGSIEKAIKHLTGQSITIYASGRTDAGVHGKEQVCHFEIDCGHGLIAFKDGVNRFTPESVSILKAEVVSENFHARFSAIAREYEFLVLNRRAPTSLWRNRAVHVLHPLDLDLMKKSLECLVGEHDFSAFRASSCESSTPMCSMQHVSMTVEGDLLKFKIKADHFLHNMIRITIGTAIDIGRGKIPVDSFERMLESKDRNDGGKTLPPQGLYFDKVYYRDDYTIFESC